MKKDGRCSRCCRTARSTCRRRSSCCRLCAAPGTGGRKKAEPRYFRILVNKPAREGKKAENVNINVPMTVVRGGLRLGALFPGMLGKKKIQLDNGTDSTFEDHYTDLEAMIKDIGELTVDVDGDAQVRIRCE